MIDLNYLRKNREEAIQRLAVRNIESEKLVNTVLDLDKERRELQGVLDANLAEANSVARKIGDLFQSGKQEEANALKEKTAALKERNKELQEKSKRTADQLERLLYDIPNIPNPKVPKGSTEADNEIVSREGTPPDLGTEAKPHWVLADTYDIIDFELGNKITGAGFPVYKNKGARLQRALVNFFLDEATKAGYMEIQPPLLINEDSGRGTGQLPDKEGQMYQITEENLYLIPTAEVPITNLYRNTILNENDLPVKNTGYTPCFRREAGSYGKDVRGLNRLHQFDKVEIVQIAHPEKSYEVLDEMVEYVKSLLKKLELPYRVARLCGGDLGFTSALTYDMEVFSAAQQKWLEVSSISNFETYQANRLKLRYKDSNGKKMLAHTLNGSALAFPRIVAAILENNQSEKGIKIPEALVNYTGFEYIN